MTIGSGSSPTSNSNEPDLEAGLRPPLARSGRSFRGYQSLAFPFPAFPSPSASSSPTSTHLAHPSTLLIQPPTPATSTVSTEPSLTKSYSSYTSSFASASSDPHYDRMLFDYRVLAQSMHGYRHLSIFRRFGRMAMANLLSYQDELTDIEAALRGVDREEQHATSPELKESRRALMRRLRETLKNYYEALLVQEQVFTQLDPPRDADAKLLGEMAPPYPTECAPSAPTQRVDEHTDDLVALGLGGRDALEKVVGRMVPRLFPRRCPSAQDLTSRNVGSRDIASLFSPFTRRVSRMAIAVGTAALMLGPMAVLRELRDEKWRLVCVVVCTLSLAVVVAAGTRGKGEGMVMVVAAYAAVLVVFVQNGGAGKC